MLSIINNLFILSVGLFLIGGLLSLFLQKKPKLSIFLAYLLASLASTAGILLGLLVLISGQSLNIVLPWTVINTKIIFTAGPLAAFFITLISLICLAVSIYSFSYTTEYIGKHNVGVLGLLYNLFIFTMIGLVSSGTSLMFIFFWELMSISSYFLVIFDHNNSHIRKAGFIYVVMTHLGTIFILIAFLILYKETGSFNFTQYAEAGHNLPVNLKNIIFILVTVGFGTKAGIIPLHIWLPKAHPAAPSNISAIMSGVMLKTAIFGFIKVVIEILGGGEIWWGVLIISLGIISALLGILYALMESDIKRMLAYSSIENIGIILIGLGVALIFLGYGKNQLALLGLTAALVHAFNHAVFKGLLFLGAGSIHYSIKTRNIEKMGGLLKRMPWTGFFFLIGAISISALPPFNGFVSEWLTFQSLLMLGSYTNSQPLNILGPIVAAALGLTSALAAACFVKAFGIQFLALPRSSNAEKAKEVPVTMRVSMGILAILCLVLGAIPVIVFNLLKPVTKTLLGTETSYFNGYQWLNVNSLLSTSTTISPLIFTIVLLLVSILIYLAIKFKGKGGKVRIDETWNCGMNLFPKMEYSATSFSKPILIIFRRLFQPRREIKKQYKLPPYFTSTIKYKSSIKPIFEDVLYRPANNLFLGISRKIRILQSGSIHIYLAYIFITLVIMLVLAR